MEALEVLSKYQTLSGGDPESIIQSKKAMSECRNALFHLKAKQDYIVSSFSGSVNSENTEYNPVISADESVMAFTAVRKDERTGQFVEKL